MMDAKALRMWGIVAGAAVMAGALVIGFSDPAPPPAPAPPAPMVDAPATPAPEALFEPAQAQQPPPAAAPAAPVVGDTLSFLVRFRGSGPLAQAQRLAERGREAQAAAAARRALARQASFAGLCFDRFTVGGAEMVLRTCTPVPRAQAQRTSERWLTRLRAMAGVAYADANAAAAAQQH